MRGTALNTEVSIETLKTERAGQPMTHRLAWIAGLREVFVKSPAGNRIGYFTDLEKALALLAEDGEYKAAWYSLNVCPRIPDGFQPDRLYRASARFNENDYAGRQQLLIDCDPKREADTASTDEQKAAAKAQALAVREFLDNLNFLRLHPLRDRRGVAAQHRRPPLDAGVEEAGVERGKTLRDRQRRHEIAPGVTDQPLHLALVVAFARSAKAVVEEVMALKLREHMRAQPLSALDDPGDREPGVVV